MSAPKRLLDDQDQDPDYASPGPSQAKQQKLYENNARAKTAKKITLIVEKEFSKEIDTKEKETLEIQNRLHTALKTLHLLRYVVITDFYNRKQCLAPQASEVKQTRIHPTIKRLIGKTPRRRKTSLEDSGPSSSQDSQYIPELHENDTLVPVKIEPLATIEPQNVKGRLEDDSESQDVPSEEESAGIRKNEAETRDEPPKKVPRYIPPKSNVPEIAGSARGVHHKVRKRIVVGNISKWIPPDWREDAASHKWMMYVRGSKDQADISDFVSKVRFFLHPSYQPNDVVEVTSPPFHLSRRGWGEFPLRVQLHYKNILNKPMDIIHYLKLDRTYTGLQTLGSETVVDVWIHTTEPHHFGKTFDFEHPSQNSWIKSEVDLSIVKQEPKEQETDDSDKLTVTIKTETTVSNKEKTVSENSCSVKIDHDYVSNERLHNDDCAEVVHRVESNVTIKHSPSQNKVETSGNITENNSIIINESIVGNSSENLMNGRKVNSTENLGANEEISKAPETSDNSKDSNEDDRERNANSVEIRTRDQPSSQFSELTFVTANTQQKPTNAVIGSPAKLLKNKRKVATEAATMKTIKAGQSLLKNVENGDVPALPIKLVKCKDKLFFMADIGKLPNNKVDLAKIAVSNVVKNILTSKGLTPKVMQGNVNTALTNVSISPRNPEDQLKKEETKVKIPTVQDSAEALQSEAGQDTKEQGASGAISPSKKNPVFLRNNVQRIDMQKLASTLKLIPSKGEPLKIMIPPAFEMTKGKQQFLVLKNNKLIPMSANNTSSLAALLNPKQDGAISKPIETNALAKILEAKRSSLLKDGNKLSVNVNPVRSEGSSSAVPQSISLLKKPVGNNVMKLESASRNKLPTILKINPLNSLLLNPSSDSIPTLQIATPLPALQVPVQDKPQLDQLSKSVKLEELVSKPVKSKVVVLKDKHKILSKKDAYEDILRSIDSVQIDDIVGTLKFIMRRIPLITKEAKDPDYRRMHPYSCTTEDEFFGYNIGKQRSHEWYRAKMARNLLRKKGFDDDELWSIKEILIWARLHGYTPVQSCFEIGTVTKTMKKLSDTSNTTTSTCTEPTELNEWLENHKDLNNPNEDSDIEVDIIQIAEPKIKTEVKQEPIDLLENAIVLEVPDELKSPCAFVNETAREIGVRLQQEEVYPGVTHCAAGRMILQAVQCLADDLMRRSLANAWERNSNKCPETIILDDVREALLSRDEFDVFTNAGLGSQQDAG